MKYSLTPLFSASLLLTLSLQSHAKELHPYLLKAGDIVFQEGFGVQPQAIKDATDSKWTHVGMIIPNKTGELVVVEAVQPVKITKLNDFVKRNPSSFYAMRLKNSEEILTKETFTKAETYLNQQIGKNYDLRFQWSDDKIYCSELVWKVYKEAAGIELCKPAKFKDLHLEHPSVKKIIVERFGSINALPLEEFIVPPSDIAKSELLVEVPKRKKPSKVKQ
ncbi:YiiX/YebB-like N1pC/P60 family cysteine hydrolase [Akkermansiaceae bacterium]|nr:YiiX/YebB-like N1pC/P60 family cysteine hydrolase [Akkermansiaceae bacterium]